ncbi:MAG: class I SAM-dependent methyltransferase [Anaerolineales bacterium]|nr:class I SAM-dependent methyltransferase [Anaerolineales bacterium]
MNDRVLEMIWTIDGDEASWSSWAEAMADAPASPFMNDMIATYKTPQRSWAVDVGCGTGRAFLPLVEAGYRVIGLDPNLDGIHLSLQRANHARLCAYPVLASAARFPVPASSIAFVVAISTLFHLGLTELISALQEIHRVLIPGGKAILHFLDLEDWRHTLAKQILPEQAPIPSYQAVVTVFCSQGKIQEWIAQAGLKLETLELKTSLTEAGQQRNWLAHCTK